MARELPLGHAVPLDISAPATAQHLGTGVLPPREGYSPFPPLPPFSKDPVLVSHTGIKEATETPSDLSI